MDLVTIPVRMVDRVRSERRPHDRADIREAVGLDETVSHVDAEAVDPSLEPEVHRFLKLCPHAVVVPVEVWLLRREQVQVPLPRASVSLGDAGPCRPAEPAHPVIGALVTAGATAVPEDKATSLGRSGAGSQRLLKPFMLVRDVIRHDVEQHPDSEPVRLGDHRLGVGQSSEHGLDVAEIRDVVAGVLHRGRVPRGYPHGVHSQTSEVRQAGAQPSNVSDAVAVTIGKAANVDLVDDRTAPPRRVRAGSARLHLRRSVVHAAVFTSPRAPDGGFPGWSRFRQ